MKRKVWMIALVAVMICSMLVGCSSTTTADNQESESPSVELTDTTENVEETEEVGTTENVGDSGENGSAVAPPAELGDQYVDLDNRSFAVNGKVYTLGKTTLQEMIDDGVPFYEDDIANAGNNVNPNYESPSFNIDVGTYHTAQVCVANYTENNMKMSECVISSVYLSVYGDEPQTVVQFAFPESLTMEDLVANAGEPTQTDEYEGENYTSNTYEYTVDSSVYYGVSGYEFKFVNGALDHVRVNWMP